MGELRIRFCLQLLYNDTKVYVYDNMIIFKFM